MRKTRAPSAKDESARPESTPRRLAADALWNYALRILAGSARSAGELREKLLRRAERARSGLFRIVQVRGADPVWMLTAPIAATAYALAKAGMSLDDIDLDDRRFAENFSAARLENQGLGKARVLSDLRKRRVAPALAEKTVGEVYRETDETRLIEDYLGRKYRNTPLAAWLAEPKHLAAAYRRLRTAGFSAANSILVLKRFAANAELLDGLAEAES